MKEPTYIRADATFRELARDFPAVRPVLEKCPTARVGKAWSLQQARAMGGEFVNEVAQAAKAEIWPATEVRRSRGMGQSVVLLIAGLVVMGLWEVGMHLTFLLLPSPGEMPLGFGATIPYWWYGLEAVQMWGWVLVAGFGLCVSVLRAGGTGTAGSGLLAAGRVLLALGLVAMVTCAFVGGPSAPEARSWPAGIGAGMVLLAGVLMVLDLLLLLRGRAMDVALLLLLLAGQWMLVWLAAAVSIQFRLGGEAMWSAELVRLLTFLPAVGFGVHLAMAMGARVLGLGALRQRALLLGLGFFNGGMLAVLPWPAAGAGLGLVRVVLFGVTMPIGLFLLLAGLNFLVPRKGQGMPAGRLMVRLAFGWLAIGLVLAAGEFLWQYSPQGAAPPSYVELYRLLLTAGFLGTFLMGLAAGAMPLFMPGALRGGRQAMAAGMLWTAGLMVYGVGYGVVLAGGPQGLLERVLWVLELGAAVRFLGAGLLGVLMLRALMAARRVRAAEWNAATDLRAVVNASPKVELALAAAHVGLLEGAVRVPAVPLGAVAVAWGWDMAEFAEMLTAAAK